MQIRTYDGGANSGYRHVKNVIVGHNTDGFFVQVSPEKVINPEGGYFNAVGMSQASFEEMVRLRDAIDAVLRKYPQPAVPKTEISTM